MYFAGVEIANYGQGSLEEISVYPLPNVKITYSEVASAAVETVTYLHTDQLGSIRAITDGDGDLAVRRNYHPFGEISLDQQDAPALALPGEDKGFVGERFDAAAGLQYLNARYYDPALGLFTSPDWFEVTEAGVGTHRYSYSGNDPVNTLDAGGNQGVVALEAIAEYRDEIKQSAEKHGVDPVGIASILFQENYWGIFKDIRNVAPYVWNYDRSQGAPTSGSFGLTEMNIGLVIDLAGIPPDAPDAEKQAYDLLSDPASAIDLAGAYLALNEKEMGQELPGSSAAFAHNMGASRYQDYLSGESPPPPSDRIAKRSTWYSESISHALDGFITLKPDNWDLYYPGVPYRGLQYQYDR